ncbi:MULTISPECIES: hypothetical protein [unclassified Bradyrhizobium]|uniref:hypothetical protein n=1 Tax=unclassified Bradyrhizobium TaxID=2631580 RepID=UPI0028ECF20F|nr:MULTISPECIES: hypothetical protein [unclassified Bradyrhizobium]
MHLHVCISAFDLRPHLIRIAATGSEDTPSIMEVDGHHVLRWTHEIAQGACGGHVVGQHNTGELGALLLRDAELRAPAEQQPGDDPILAATAETLAPGSSVSLAIASFS